MNFWIQSRKPELLELLGKVNVVLLNDGEARQLTDCANLVKAARWIMVPHGSVTVDGVSLTVNDLPVPGVVQLSLIDYTIRHTTLGDRAVGDMVHVEADMMGKYAQRLLMPYLGRDQGAPKGKS